ncbi:hypothetical protein R3P38DRAFT_3223607 [Favolaschia claudopus]|uniref:Uncharacterized protein n=1 Tax=Favolaschia claudopus TaxID=2862362 RepID=A0AAV9ZYA0_9AGAR
MLKARRDKDPLGTTHLYASLETNDWSPKATIDRTVLRPFKMLAGEPILVLVTLYLSVVYGVLLIYQSVEVEKAGPNDARVLFARAHWPR